MSSHSQKKTHRKSVNLNRSRLTNTYHKKTNQTLLVMVMHFFLPLSFYKTSYTNILTIKLRQIQNAPAFLPLASASTAKKGAAGSATRHGSAASHAPPVSASVPSTPDTQPVLQPCVKHDRLSANIHITSLSEK